MDILLLLIKEGLFALYRIARFVSERWCLRIALFAEKHIRPGSTFINLVLADISFGLGDEKEAIRYWSKLRDKIRTQGPKRNGRVWQDIYIYLLAKYGEIERIEELLFGYMRGSFGFTDMDVKALFKEYYSLDPDHFAENLARIEERMTPVLKWMPIIPIERISSQTVELEGGSKMRFACPSVFESADAAPLREVEIAAQRVSCVTDCQVISAFQVIKDGSFVQYEPASHPQNGTVAGVWRNFLHMPGGSKDKAIWFGAKLSAHEIQEGILLSGRATENYFHWLIEYLPRLLNVIDAKISKDVPLIVKDNLPSQMYEVLKAVNPGYPILKIDPEKKYLSCKKLWIPSFQTHVSDDFNIPLWMGGGFSKRHLQFIRAEVFRYFGINEDSLRPLRQIYLARGGSRNLANIQQIEKILDRQGFEKILPEKLSFEQQVRLMSETKVVVGVTGAAMSNLLFLPKGSRVVALIADRYKDYSIKANIANLVGADFTYITGEQIASRTHLREEVNYVQSNFKVDADTFSKAIQQASRDPV